MKTVILTPFVGVAAVIYHALKGNAPDTTFVFTDNNVRLHGKIYDGVEIISAENAKKKYADAKVILCSFLHEAALNNQYSLLGFSNIVIDPSKLFDITDIEKALQEVHTEEMISINPALESEYKNFMKLYNVYSIPGYALEKDAILLNSLSLFISQRCNLRCKDCGGCRQYQVTSADYPLETNIKTFDSSMAIIDYVRELGISGGEPLLYKWLAELLIYIHTSVHKEKIGRITLVTNGTIMPDEKTLTALRDCNISVYISDYGEISKRADELAHAFDVYNITYKRYRQRAWYDMCKILDGDNISDAQALETFERCENGARNISNGKFFPCAFLAVSHDLKAVPHSFETYVDLMDGSATREDIKKCLTPPESGFFPGCRWCSGCNFSNMPQVEAAVQIREPVPYKKYE